MSQQQWVVAFVVLMGCAEKLPARLEGQVGTVTILPGKPTVDLRADVNRNGVVELEVASDDDGEDTWDSTHGAIVLPNIDDDLAKCPKTDTGGRQFSDLVLPDCNDGADAVINGDDDLADLAPLLLRAWPAAPAGTVARLTVDQPSSSRVRVFQRVGDRYEVVALDTALPLTTLQTGAALFLEATDLVRDSSAWDGFITLTLEVTVPPQKYWESGVVRDVVRIKVAPVLTFHHGLATETAYVSNLPRDPDSAAFRAALQTAVTAANPNITLEAPNVQDQWAQDFFETGYASMPGLNGTQKVMRVFFRSANIEDPTDQSFPMRAAGRIVFTRFRGKNVAGVQQVDLRSPPETQSLNSFGNLETIPPYTLGTKSWPLGRVLRGSVPGFAPDTSFSAMTESQRYQEPSVNVDTSWLLVGHVDETVSFIKASTPRGWIVLVNDARLARTMLEAQVALGRGGVKMFIGQQWIDDEGVETPAETTIAQVLANPEVMQASAEAAVKVDAQLAIIRRETGLTDAEIVRIPYLHEPTMGGSLAYQPGTVNLFVINGSTIAPPDPHGPIIDGKDLFKTQLETAVAPYQLSVKWLDDWNLYHREAGEVHCGTNAMREIPSIKWWEVTP